MANRKCFEALTDKELIEEIRWRRNRRTWMVGAADCSIHADVIRLCREILKDRGVEIGKED